MAPLITLNFSIGDSRSCENLLRMYITYIYRRKIDVGKLGLLFSGRILRSDRSDPGSIPGNPRLLAGYESK